jgi:predicted RNase H-like HicB family nuclease
MSTQTTSKTKTEIEIIIEKQGNHFWGRTENKGFMPTGQGKTIAKLLQNIMESIEDYVEHEGRKDKFWNKINPVNLEFLIRYDLQAFFEEFEELKISSIAKRANLNESLLRQYASGNKYPSPEQAKKIETALHELGEKLNNVALYAG